ncbi:uncharacterized protein [Cardiocondyla obscurior]|uniref:uncharacterized protein isoform X2 n=1 Tax=Cardiocondyla obscurior TaxID=286306 RepID=UPI0039655E06
MLLTAALIAKHHPAPLATTTATSNNHRREFGSDETAACCSLTKAWASYCHPALVLRSLKASSRGGVAEMSGIEEPQNATEQDNVRDEVTEVPEVSNEASGAIEKSDSAEQSEELSAKEPEEEIKEKKQEEIKEKEQEEIKKEDGEVAEIKEAEEVKEKKQVEVKEKEREETEKVEANETPSCEETREETPASELATVTRSASSDDGVPAVRQTEPSVEVPLATTVNDGDGQRRRSGPNTAVGEWNSLPILVERLREALELSLAANCRRNSDEPTATSPGNDGTVDRSCALHSMEQALLGSDHNCISHESPVSRKDELKFLEDLLLSDIQTALSRLRETIERTDVAALAKHGGVSDPTSKLYLLRLVSSLLSRLQVPMKDKETGKRELDISESERTTDVAAQGGGAPPGRRRRPVRHTIGVSAEEIARARRQLEESNVDLVKSNDQAFPAERPEAAPSASRNATTNGERPHVEEIHDKYTKDVINQRQSLRDRNKDVNAYQPLIPQIGYADRPALRPADEPSAQTRYRDHVDRQEKASDDEESALKRASEEQSRVSKLAAALRERAELISVSKCNGGSNKFAAKKSKIKRANTIDIPSYLKLQTDSLGYDNPGRALRRPINVGDRITTNASNLAVPSFTPKTENDKKFLALINRNNDTQAYNAVPAFVKSFGYSKTTDMPQTNENWNSRFSNIKTAFDKLPSANDADKLSPKLQSVAKRFPDAAQASQIQTEKRTPIDGNPAHNGIQFASANKPRPDAGFRHAPSSLFRKIEKPHESKSPPGHQWQRDNALSSKNSLREKAKMFDRNSNQPRSPSFNANESTQKFPRPPWIEHERNDGKSNKMVTENGRLDYRLFCKQFAPFIGKNTAPEVKSAEDTRKHSEHAQRKNLAPLNEKLGVVDGKISFKVFPEKVPLAYRPNESRRAVEEPTRDKFDVRDNKKNVFKPLTAVHNDDLSEAAFTRNAPVDAMLKGSSSVAIQTGVNDTHPEEARVFRVIPKVAKEPSAYSNVSVQTYTEPEVEAKEHWTIPKYSDASEPSHFVLDHNRNYRAVSNVNSRNDISPLFNKSECDFVKEDIRAPAERTSLREIYGHRLSEEYEPLLRTSPRCESFSPKTIIDNRLQVFPTYIPYVKSNKNSFEDLSASHELSKENSSCASDNAFPDEHNIKNQDISADAGVVTRYTCAIATVASTNVPAQADEARLEPGASPVSSSSSSQFWPHHKPANNEIGTTEDEIRRHNLLQQSLVRQLQNERVMLNDHTSVTSQPGTKLPTGNFNPYVNLPKSNSVSQPLKLEPPEAPKRNFQKEPPKRPELPKRLESPRRSQSPKRSEPSRRLESPRKLEPSKRLESPAVVTGLLSVSPSSGFAAKNRITALREQYEQPGGQMRSLPAQKEHSPVPNGTMDSSDEYLVSCANKLSRSIVLSKSESWHQLAVSKGQHAPTRSAQGKLPLQPFAGTGFYPPKPPKPKSPSSFKMKKQYEASSDSVKKMENKIRRYFDSPAGDEAAEARDSKGRRFSSRDSAKKSSIGLSRSRTMPGICDESMRLTIPTAPQISVASLNSAEVDKVFDDIFEEATRTDDYHF